MKTTVIGATSASGIELTKQLLQNGHAVYALARTPERLDISGENLTIVKGDVLKPESLGPAIEKSKVVLSFLGPKGDQKTIAARGTENIVSEMKKKNVDRLIVISVAGIAVEEDERKKGFIDRLLKTFLKEMYADREAQLDVLHKSGLKWTALRVPRLTNESATGEVQAFFGKPSPSMKICRADLAAFMIREMKENKWVGKAPIVASG